MDGPRGENGKDLKPLSLGKKKLRGEMGGGGVQWPWETKQRTRVSMKEKYSTDRREREVLAGETIPQWMGKPTQWGGWGGTSGKMD